MYQSFAFVFPHDLDITNAPDLQIYKGFVLTLPFRIRTGRFFSLQINSSFDVIFHNHLDIPLEMASDEIEKLMWLDKKFRPHKHFYTEVLILDKKQISSSKFRKDLVSFLDKPNEINIPSIEDRSFEALSSLNDAIVGYHHATNNLFGGSPIKRIGVGEFSENLKYLHTIVCPNQYQLSQKELLEIIDARPDREYRSFSGIITDQLNDISNVQLEKIEHYTALHQHFLFYQFALDAKSRMLEKDYVSALLFAVIALEGAHSALLQLRLNHILQTSISDKNNRLKQAESISNTLKWSQNSKKPGKSREFDKKRGGLTTKFM